MSLVGALVAMLLSFSNPTWESLNNDSDTMLLNKWRSYVGWTNRDIVNSPSSQIGMRLKASQGSTTFIMIQSGRRIGYELFDSKTKKRLFGVRFDGSQVWIIDLQGKKRSVSRNVAAHFVTESLIFSNSIAELNATLKERGNGEETWTVRPLLYAYVDITLNSNTGLCKAISLEVDGATTHYVPITVTPINAQQKFYAGWLRDNEAPINIFDLEPHARIYDGDI